MQTKFAGLWPPVSTPFTASGEVNHKQLVRHGKALLSEGATGLAVLGTTSEATSLSLAERRAIIDAAVHGGISPGQLLPGTGSPSLADAVELTRHAGDLGCAGVLLLPPYYYKNATEDGIFTFVARLIDRVGAKVPRILLYHIPPMAVLGWSEELIGRIIEAYPDIVVGMKDSAGDLDHLKRMITAFPGFAVFPGAESHLLASMLTGGVGCISATGNINAARIVDLIRRYREPGAQRLQDELINVRKSAEAPGGLIPSIKAILSVRYNDPSWAEVRPPLMPLTEKARAELLARPAIMDLLATAA
jgi:4-hydroxy-tetrahydrodipicolinate synthase